MGDGVRDGIFRRAVKWIGTKATAEGLELWRDWKKREIWVGEEVVALEVPATGPEATAEGEVAMSA